MAAEMETMEKGGEFESTSGRWPGFRAQTTCWETALLSYRLLLPLLTCLLLSV